MKETRLHNTSMGVNKGTRLATPEEMESNSEIEQIDIWELVLIDRDDMAVTKIAFERETRDELVRQLTGGIVLAGGDLPRV